MIRTLLIANRGEIACRIIRTAKRMGIATVAVYSDADRDALHVQEADRAVRIGGALPKESYLNGAAIIQAAKQTGANAVHPGYGFLSENAEFAAACAAAGLIFVGPPVDAIHAMGDKSRARQLMVKAGVPVVPGYEGADQDEAAFAKAAEQNRLSAAGQGGVRRRRDAACAGSSGRQAIWDRAGQRPARGGKRFWRWDAAAGKTGDGRAPHRISGVCRPRTAIASIWASATARRSAGIRR
jgi:pyruvate carboxylase